MSYAIANIIFGVNLSSDNWRDPNPQIKALRDALPSDAFDGDYEEQGFRAYYGNDSAEGFGVEMPGFDESDDYTGKQLIALLTPSEEVVQKFQKLLGDLLGNPDISQEAKDLMSKIEPEVHVIWGSS